MPCDPNVTRPPLCDEVELCAATEGVGEGRLDLGSSGRSVASAVCCHISRGRQGGHNYTLTDSEFSYEQ
jgi:hypothetical protein